MASLSKIIRSFRNHDLKTVEEILAQIASLDHLQPEEEKILYSYQQLREELLNRQDSEVYSIAEIRAAKQLAKRNTVTNKGTRW